MYFIWQRYYSECTHVVYRYVVSHSTYVRHTYRIILLVGECTALLANGSKPTTLNAATCSTENSTYCTYHIKIVYLPQSMSRGCTKVFFWSSPYACHSETVSCSHTAGSKLFDFTPLRVNSREKAWRTRDKCVCVCVCVRVCVWVCVCVMCVCAYYLCMFLCILWVGVCLCVC